MTGKLKKNSCVVSENICFLLNTKLQVDDDKIRSIRTCVIIEVVVARTSFSFFFFFLQQRDLKQFITILENFSLKDNYGNLAF